MQYEGSRQRKHRTSPAGLCESDGGGRAAFCCFYRVISSFAPSYRGHLAQSPSGCRLNFLTSEFSIQKGSEWTAFCKLRFAFSPKASFAVLQKLRLSPERVLMLRARSLRARKIFPLPPNLNTFLLFFPLRERVYAIRNAVSCCFCDGLIL